MQLLGRVLLARHAADARRLRASARPVCRVVTTLAGELLEPDGTLTVGPRKAEAGLVSRKSELRDLPRTAPLHVRTDRRRRKSSSRSFADRPTPPRACSKRCSRKSRSFRRGRRPAATVRPAAAAGRTARRRIESLRVECNVLELQVRRGRVAHGLRRGAGGAGRAGIRGVDRPARGAEAGDSRTARRTATAGQQAHTAAQVSLSRAAADRDTHAASARAVRRRPPQAARSRPSTSARPIRHPPAAPREHPRRLRASPPHRRKPTARRKPASGIADLTAKAAADREPPRRGARPAPRPPPRVAGEAGRGARPRAGRPRLDRPPRRGRRPHPRGLRDRAERRSLSGERRTPRKLGRTPIANPLCERSRRSTTCKRKLARLGSVNMEALEELDPRRGRVRPRCKPSTTTSTAPATRCRRSSTRSTRDSRKLFTDTLAAVRGYFQELFRKLFGGGQADIVLEDEADVLESGIEITARPPGKELRALSLLSGGEKTLTAIALLLAIFRNKPSPVLHAGRSGRGAGRGEHDAPGRRAARVPGPAVSSSWSRTRSGRWPPPTASGA